MSNELLFFITIVASMTGVVLCFRLFGKKGLFCWMIFAGILANIETTKLVYLFGLPINLGAVIYGSNFLCTDIINDHWGGKESRRAVFIGFFCLIAFTLLSQLTLMYSPAPEDYASEALGTIFGAVPQITLASLVAYLVSNTLDTYTFDWIKHHSRHLWVRNNLSTITSQIVDSFVFSFIAFAGMFSVKTIFEMTLVLILLKVIVAVLDTPFAYWGRVIARKRYPITTNN